MKESGVETIVELEPKNGRGQNPCDTRAWPHMDHPQRKRMRNGRLKYRWVEVRSKPGAMRIKDDEDCLLRLNLCHV